MYICCQFIRFIDMTGGVTATAKMRFARLKNGIHPPFLFKSGPQL